MGSVHRAVEQGLALADPAFVRDRMTEGLSSGEGLIWQVRDPIYKSEKAGKGKDSVYHEVFVDPGEDDKRLWVELLSHWLRAGVVEGGAVGSDRLGADGSGPR